MRNPFDNALAGWVAHALSFNDAETFQQKP
jgi:hypothetical protein